MNSSRSSADTKIFMVMQQSQQLTNMAGKMHIYKYGSIDGYFTEFYKLLKQTTFCLEET